MDCASFQHLKSLLTNAPILRIVNPDEDLIIYIYACKEGISGILSQNRHVVFYESINLKEHERLYATHELELAAIVHTLKML
jgi:hypothetical protein